MNIDDLIGQGDCGDVVASLPGLKERVEALLAQSTRGSRSSIRALALSVVAWCPDLKTLQECIAEEAPIGGHREAMAIASEVWRETRRKP